MQSQQAKGTQCGETQLSKQTRRSQMLHVPISVAVAWQRSHRAADADGKADDVVDGFSLLLGSSAGSTSWTHGLHKWKFNRLECNGALVHGCAVSTHTAALLNVHGRLQQAGMHVPAPHKPHKAAPHRREGRGCKGRSPTPPAGEAPKAFAARSKSLESVPPSFGSCISCVTSVGASRGNAVTPAERRSPPPKKECALVEGRPRRMFTSRPCAPASRQ